MQPDFLSRKCTGQKSGEPWPRSWGRNKFKWLSNLNTDAIPSHSLLILILLFRPVNSLLIIIFKLNELPKAGPIFPGLRQLQESFPRLY